MNWYLKALKKYSVFGGRARRKEYWYFTLFNFLAFFLLTFIDDVIGNFNSEVGIGLLGGIYVLAVLIPTIAVSVRRLHDTNRCGWWLFIELIPVIGTIVLLIFRVQDSQQSENQYGLNPKFDNESSSDTVVMVVAVAIIILFIIMVAFLARGLDLHPSEIPSPLLNKSAPAFSASKLQAPEEKLTPADLKGKVWLFNVWASWCVSCRSEHPVLNQLAQQKAAIIVGLNYKDEPDAALGWLEQLGNPYDVSIMDQDGRIGIDYGVYGVPETFVIDKQGLIRYKHTGPVTPEDVQQLFLPLIAKLQAEN